ncbi:MAG: cell division protein FtsX [Crocinitomicaceae bacterium]|nr:cell division protein FtsX [Crocinitomicaceae bacterium]|tara:strand:- start:230 stop:1105 length:876 start_codon:yes stop_codon:yes gene_type:complete
MSKSPDKIERRRLNSSYFSVVVSITLVLLMLGFLGSILLKARELSTYVKENIGFSIYLNDGVKEVEVKRLQKSLDAAKYVKTSHFVDKETAAQVLQEDLGEDFVDFLGHNPLLASIDVYLNADYAHPDSIAWIEKDLLKNPKVKEVYYQKDLLSVVNQNIKQISFVLLIFSALLLVIAIALINNSIRLAIYSKRFLIKSMQLVGATQAFIRRPFVVQGVIRGVVSAFIANSLIFAAWYFLNKEFPEIFEIRDVELFASLFVIVMILGVLISWFSTSLAVRKYLRIKTEHLY